MLFNQVIYNIQPILSYCETKCFDLTYFRKTENVIRFFEIIIEADPVSHRRYCAGIITKIELLKRRYCSSAIVKNLRNVAYAFSTKHRRKCLGSCIQNFKIV